MFRNYKKQEEAWEEATCYSTCSNMLLYHKGNPNNGSVEWTNYGCTSNSNAEVKNGQENGNPVRTCEHLSEVKMEELYTCVKPLRGECPECKRTLSVISAGIYISPSDGKQACKEHYKEKKDDCDRYSIVHKINTMEVWCRKCNLEFSPKLGEILFKKNYIECVHLKIRKLTEAAKEKRSQLRCGKCLPSRKSLVCLMCEIKICCIQEAKHHSRVLNTHQISLDLSTNTVYCHSCQKEFSYDEYSNVSIHGEHIKERCKAIFQKMSSSSPKPVPIYNTGNICYFITVIQNLRNCEQLSKCYASVISGDKFKETYTISEENFEVSSTVKPFTAALWEVLNETEQKKLQTCVRHLLNLMGQRNGRFAGGSQQDSHEALRQILDALRMEEIDSVKEAICSKFGRASSSDEENDSELKDYLRQAVKIQTVVDKVFGGKTVNTVVCRECQNVLQITESQLDLSLPISDETSISKELSGKDSSTPFSEDQSKLRIYLKDHNLFYQYLEKHDPWDQFTINQCLECFTTLDVLDENNKFCCDKCTKAESLCSKQLLIHSLPPVLVLHLKRFHLYPKVTKNNKHIKFELMLNMAPFCTNECFEDTTADKADNIQDITPDSLQMTTKKADKPKTIYALKGVIVHNGSLHSGHYYTFLRTTMTTEQFQTDCKNIGCYDESAGYKGNWYCANDSVITHISEAHKGIPEEVAGSSGYLLFYEQLSLKSSNNDCNSVV